MNEHATESDHKSYPVAGGSDWEFPSVSRFTCYGCDRVVEAGFPYVARLVPNPPEHVMEAMEAAVAEVADVQPGSGVTSVLTCVYCSRPAREADDE